MQRLLENFRHYTENLAWQKQEVFSRSAEGQNPLAVLVTCSDSRIFPETFLRLDPGELFVIRNAGNMIDDANVGSGELASIEYAVKVLQVQDIVICGHYHCGAIKAIVAQTPLDGFDHVPAWLKHGRAVMENALGGEIADSKLSLKQREDAAVEANVLEQVERLSRVPFVEKALQAGTVRLHAWVLRFESHGLLSYDPHEEKFIPISDNPMSHPTYPKESDCCSVSPEGLLDSGTSLPTTPSPQAAVAPRTWQNIASDLKDDVIASLGLFCVSLPFCIAISRASNVSLGSGITSALVGSWLVTALSGKRLLVSGPSSSLIAIAAACAMSHGVVSLAMSVILAGLIQALLGFARLGPWFRAASPALIFGLLAGIGASLFVQQLHLAVDEQPHVGNWQNLLEVPIAFINVFREHGHEGHRPAAVVGVITVLAMWAWDRRKTKRRFAWIPSILVGIVLAAGVRTAFQLPIETVRVDSSLLSFVDWRNVPSDMKVWWSTIIPTAFALALAASSESMLTLIATEKATSDSKAKPNRELVTQGIGNIASGALGGLPIAIALVRSQVNLDLKARSFVSVALHGLWLIVFIGLLPFVLSRIPTAALAAVLAVTGIKMINFARIRALLTEHRTEGIICLITALSVFSFGILVGVGIGLTVSVLLLLHVFSRLRIRVFEDAKSGSTQVVLEGTANFLRLPKLTETLETLAQRPRVRIETSALSYLDHSILSAIEAWSENRERQGLVTELDTETLRSRFKNAKPRPRQN